ncbi:hypothetical protein OL548_13815 [Lysinibacillus sp. MHQ-1]|nr:hypothetical protein OL548_13815 [Lysinibacillus sp. MHQ-1]
MQDAEKVAIIKELALDVYVDDKPAVLETLHNIQTKVIFKKINLIISMLSYQDCIIGRIFLALIEA